MQVTAREQDLRMTGVARVAIPATRSPEQRTAGDADSRLNVTVVFTSVESTMAALRTAGALANKLGVRITLLVPEVVPYHLPLEKPAILQDWNERRFRVLAAGSPVETNVRFYFCRDRDETLAGALKAHSLVVIGGRKRWWPTWLPTWLPTEESRLARRLRRLGHEVILAETE